MNKEILALLLNRSRTNASFQHVDLTEVSEGNSSHVWIVSDEKGKRVVIKEYPDWVTNQDLQWIHEYMDKLSEKGLPVAKSLGPIVKNGARFWAAYEFADGERFNPDHDSNIIDMGRMMARIHMAGRGITVEGDRNWFSVANKNSHPRWIEKFKEMLIDQSLMQNLQNARSIFENGFNFAQQEIKKTLKQPLPIHGDFRTENVRFNNSGKVQKVFDFGNARNDYVEADLAITLKDFVRDTEKQSIFLTAYTNSITGDVLDPKLLYACEVTLCAHECAYLFSIASRNDLTKFKFKGEIDYLYFLCKNIPERIQFYSFQK